MESNGEAKRPTKEFTFSEVERRGLILALRVRGGAILATMIYMAIEGRMDADTLHDLTFPLAFLALGGIQYLLLRRRLFPKPAKLLFITLDIILFTYMLLSVDGIFGGRFPRSFVFRSPAVSYLSVFLIQAALSLSPSTVVWCGLNILFIWGGAAVWVAHLPGVYVSPSWVGRPTNQQILQILADPHFLDAQRLGAELLVTAIATAGLAVVAQRSRRMVRAWTSAERARGNLARYFSPKMVDSLAGRDQPLGPIRRQSVAALFADIRGFTGMSEAMEPEEVMRLLREFHGAMEGAIFAHDGTMEKYIGDALLATFGVPDATAQDASNALRCGLEMLDTLKTFNARRVAEGKTALGIGVGLHYGPAVLGDIGSGRNMAFAVIGDTVNSASRLQSMTRKLDSDLVVSQVFLDQVARESGDDSELLQGFVSLGPQVMRGRKEPILVAMKERAPAATDEPGV